MNAVAQCIIFSIKNNNPENISLIEPVFISAIKFLTLKRNTGWVYRVCVLPESKDFFKSLSTDDINLVFENLLIANKIDFDLDKMLAYIAEINPTSVWNLFWERLKIKDEHKGYEAIPYNFYDLGKILAMDADLAIISLRKWYRLGDLMFEFTGGRLIHAVFKNFSENMSVRLEQIVDSGSDEDFEFVIHILHDYCGEPATHEVFKKLIDRLPESDPKIEQLSMTFDNTGVVCGKFGFVESFRIKKDEMTSWLDDTRPKVKNFAVARIRRLEQKIAAEQRSAEQRAEDWRREWE